DMLTGALRRAPQRRRDEVEPIEMTDGAAEPPDQLGTSELNGQLRRLHQVDDTNIINAGLQRARVDVVIERHQRSPSDAEPMPDQVAGEFEFGIVQLHNGLQLQRSALTSDETSLQ